jgi:polyhydroxyalkanoate synthesis regulator phasin
MAKKKDKDILARLADAGEDAIVQLTKTSAGKALVDAANNTRARVDELSKRVRGVEALEARVSALEKQVAALKKKPAARKAAASKPAARTPAAPTTSGDA